jgi:hypothetical protein
MIREDFVLKREVNAGNIIGKPGAAGLSEVCNRSGRIVFMVKTIVHVVEEDH